MTDNNQAPLYVLGLSAENFMRLEAIDLKLDPAGGITIFSGANGHGKSSALRAIEATLEGAGAIPQQPIRVGSDHAQTTVVLGRDGKPEFTVTRRYRDSGTSSVEIRAADGTKVSSPQSLLDAFFSATTFNPVEWAFPPGEKTADGRNRARLKMLLAISPLPIDLERHDAETKRLTQLLSAARRRLKESEVVITDRVATGSSGEVPSGPEENETPLADELAKIRAERRHREAAQSRAEAIRRESENIRAQVKLLEQRLAELETEAKEVEGKLAAPVAGGEEKVAADLAALRERNASRRAAAADIIRAEERAKAALRDRHEVDDLETRIKTADEKRAEAIEAAKFPVRSLTILSDGTVAVRLKSGQTVPVEQCSTAQKVLLSFAIGSSRDPRLRTALIHDGNDLDNESLAAIARMARERGYQLIAERIVPNSCGVSIMFREGSAEPIEPRSEEV